MPDIIFDEAESEFNLDSVSRTAQGYLKLDGYSTRFGVFKYRMPDGSFRNELRAPKEVLKSLETMDGLPVSSGHPIHNGAYTLLDQKNTHIYQRGYYVGTPQVVGDRIKTTRVITDPQLEGEILSKVRRQTSLGYRRDFVPGPHPDYPNGTYDGEKYDGWQDNIINNHEAIVIRARGGDRCCLMLDSIDGEMTFDSYEIEPSGSQDKKKEVPKMAQIRCDGRDYEVTDSVATALEYKFKADEAEKKQLKDSADAEKGRADGLQARFDEAEAQLAEAKKVNIDAIINSRLELRQKSSHALPSGFKFDGLDDTAIKTAVLKHNRPQLDLTGKSAIYIEAAYDAVMDGLPESQQVSPQRGGSPNYRAAIEKTKTTAATGTNMDSDEDDIVGKAMMARESRYKSAYTGGKK